MLRHKSTGNCSDGINAPRCVGVDCSFSQGFRSFMCLKKLRRAWIGYHHRIERNARSSRVGLRR